MRVDRKLILEPRVLITNVYGQIYMQSYILSQNQSEDKLTIP